MHINARAGTGRFWGGGAPREHILRRGGGVYPPQLQILRRGGGGLTPPAPNPSSWRGILVQNGISWNHKGGGGVRSPPPAQNFLYLSTECTQISQKSHQKQ